MTLKELNTLWMERVCGYTWNAEKQYWEKTTGKYHYTISHMFPKETEVKIKELREIGVSVPDAIKE